MITKEELAERIVAIRKEKGMSRYKLIKEAKLNPNTVIAFEKDGSCTLTSFIAMVNTLGLDIELKNKEL